MTTLSEALTLPAGRELDAVVGEKIFELNNIGWWRRRTGMSRRWEKCGKDDTTLDLMQWKAELMYKVDDDFEPVWVPYFSTCIESSWLIVEKLKDAFSYGIWETNRLSSVQQEPIVVFRYSIFPPSREVHPDDPESFCSHGETVPLAICRAALKATWQAQPK